MSVSFVATFLAHLTESDVRLCPSLLVHLHPDHGTDEDETIGMHVPANDTPICSNGSYVIFNIVAMAAMLKNIFMGVTDISFSNSMKFGICVATSSRGVPHSRDQVLQIF